MKPFKPILIISALLLLSLSFNVFATSIDVSGTYTSPEIWDVDTVHILGDCTFDELTIAEGTIVLFHGNYTLKPIELDAIGSEEDSIIFTSYSSLGIPEQIGNIFATCQHKGPCSRFEFVRISNLNRVSISLTENSLIENNDSVHMYKSESCKFQFNNDLIFIGKIKNSIVKNNDQLHYSPSYDLTMGITGSSFMCDSNIFQNNNICFSDSGSSYDVDIDFTNNRFINNGGPIIRCRGGDELSGYISISYAITDNEFINNTGPIIQANEGVISYLTIYRNKFIENEGLSINSENSNLRICRNIFSKNVANDGPGAIYSSYSGPPAKTYISNNTFFENQGSSYGCMYIKSGYHWDSIYNNIYWENTALASPYQVAFDLDTGPPWESNFLSHSVAHDTANLYILLGDDFNTSTGIKYQEYPEFVDTLNHDFRLTHNSPCIDKGFSNDGTDTVDIGAYEYYMPSIPKILKEPSDMSIRIGDKVKLEIITNGIYEFRWFRNDQHINYSTTNILRRESMSVSDTGIYQARISSVTDTIWSTKFRVSILPPLEIDLPETSYFCAGDFVLLSTGLTEYQHLWSTGETTAAITVTEPGVYEVFISLDGIHGATYQAVVEYMPSKIEISGTYEGTQQWCTDTLLVVGNCMFNDTLIINPGTEVLFQDNYMLSAFYFYILGIPGDSIYFSSANVIPDKNEGKIDFYFDGNFHGMPEQGSITNAHFSNLSSVKVSNTSSSSFNNCNKITILRSEECKLTANDTIIFQNSINRSRIAGNNYLNAQTICYGHYACNYNIISSSFINNASTLFVDGYTVSVERNIFRDYTVTPLNINGLSWGGNVSNNIFLNIRAASETGALRIRCTPDNSPEYPLSVVNNTFYNNLGTQTNHLELITSNNFNLDNNIFWSPILNSGDELKVDNLIFEQAFLRNNIFQKNSDGINIQIESGDSAQIQNLYSFYPEFVDTTATSNFELTKLSSAINAGYGSRSTFIDSKDFNNNCRFFGNAIDIGAYEYIPSGSLLITAQSNDTLICFNDSVELSVSTNDIYEYQWYWNEIAIEDAEDSQLVLSGDQLKNGDSFQLKINSLEDTIWSAPIVLTIAHSPEILSELSEIQLCFGSDDEISIEYSSDFDVNIKWFSANNGLLDEVGKTLKLTGVSEDDSFYSTVNDRCGSDSAQVAILSVVDLPELDLGNDTTLYPGDSILLDPGTYETYLWSSGSVDQSIYAEGGQTISLEVSNEFGCSNSDTITIYLYPIEGLDPDYESGIQFLLYPNPASEMLKIKPSQEFILPYTISVFSENGSLVYLEKIESEGIQTIKLSDNFKKGTYHLKIQSVKFIGFGNFVVQ